MGNCVISKNSKKIKQKAKYQYNKRNLYNNNSNYYNHHHHHHHIRRDNGDILNHIEQISPLNISPPSSHSKEIFAYPTPIVVQIEQKQIEDNEKLMVKCLSEATTSTTESLSKTTVSITPPPIDEINEVVFDDKSLWQYRSLQKSRKSIKKLEETLKSTNSIEQWLTNQAISLNDNEDNILVASPPQLSSPNSIDSTTAEVFDDLATFDYLQQHHALAHELYELNQKCNYYELETKYKQFIKNFFIPRSLSYSQDIQLLKWLINNFTLNLYQPINQQKFYSNYDKLTKIQKRLYIFLLQPLDLSIDLVERDNTNAVVVDENNKNELVFEYYKEFGQIRGQLTLNSNDEQRQNDEMQSESSKSKKLFLLNFLKTSNSVSTTSLINSKLKLAISPLTSTKSVSLMTTASTSKQNNNLLSYYDLNERLFTCFLSNFSCQLAENFIKSLHEYHVSYIRKSNLNDYFSYIEISKDTSEHQVIESHEFNSNCHKQTLNVNEYRFKLCLKLTQWPVYYEEEFFGRLDRVEWPSRKQLMKLKKEMCLLVNELPNLMLDDEAMSLYFWTIDYSLAETHLLRNCLSKKQKFYYYLLYYIIRELILNEVEHRLDNKNQSNSIEDESSSVMITEPLKYINYERLFMHHYFRFLELFSFDLLKLNSVCVIKKFISYLTNIKSLSQANYFHKDLFIEHNFSSNHDELISINIKKLNKLCESTQSQTIVNLDTFINYLKFNFNFFNSNTKMSTSTSIKNWCFYSTYSYIYEYIYDYTCSFYRQFALKRDNFKISEEHLIATHNEIVKHSTIFSQIEIDQGDYCYLLNQYEVYAEYVNKYLSQIRNYNQYLLFHYIWTMQVQYLTPFFNYIIDKYKIF